MSDERKFEEDKVYLQGPDGVIWEYDTLLSNAPGYKPVTPNPSKIAQAEAAKAAKADEAEAAKAADAAKANADANAKAAAAKAGAAKK